MVERILAPVAAWIIMIISAGGYLGIVGLMAIESACIPLPSEIIMPFAGYLVSTGRFSLFWVATAGAIGCNVGSILAYEVGKRGGRPFVERYGKYVLLNMHDLELAERFFARWGSATVLICRLLPFVRSFIAFPAGVARMPLAKFHLYTFVGSWPWCFGLAWVGMKLGAAWHTDPRLGKILHGADAAVVAVLAIGIAFILWHKLKKPR
ncbi:DedA family protein [Sphingomonas sp. BIUV-7]|uniref:DedA family protein n=1 Tax=Sphingomonas natans TaxID=3063330 RepID=A0ABT8YEH8_9SPHN|nr:DedA family protein [Sphingomonas sp. BIUV-7]MDO6416753.1 DedA family protein [Sphingomonas sp. BIUV-7]